MTDVLLDPFDADLVQRAPSLLREFNEAGVLAASDVHVALRLARLGDEHDESVALAAALAVRAPRIGHVYTDLATIRDTATLDTDEPVDLSGLPWPAADEWVRRLGSSSLVASGDDDGGEPRPLRLVGALLYLDRYWREERRLAADLLAFGSEAASGVDAERLENGLTRLFDGDGDGDGDSTQRAAAATAVERRLAVVAGEPGTGKTTTVARIVALLAEQAEATESPAPLVALAAPTAKAAQRLEEAVHEEAGTIDVAASVRDTLLALEASTLHRLLGWRPGSHSRFRHHRGNRLPHDVVVVDETSMVSLSLMARVVEAVRPDARLILVGDPGQLASIEAGVVLGDIVGPAAAAERAAVPGPLAASIVVLDHPYRFGRGIGALAEAVGNGDADAVLERLENGGDEGVSWIPVDAAAPEATDALAVVRERTVATARAVVEAAAEGDAERAIDALGAFRVLCAHRRGDHGVAAWTARIEGWLAGAIGNSVGDGPWYVGRPLLVTENDYGLPLFNGDTGVVVAEGGGGVTAAFQRRGAIVEFRPSRLEAVDTVYAMTVHKSQGSQFDTAAVLLPPPTSRILTRELLYTAVTRAREQLIVVGTEEAIRAAVARPVARASGLRRRLWGS
jgi:exodeoxyribonuclease V alpha subunit